MSAQSDNSKFSERSECFHEGFLVRPWNYADDVFLQFNRNAERNCPPLAPVLPAPPEGRAVFGGRHIWKSLNVTTFRAQIGPTGGSRGYEKVTGQSGWGISWWINEELIPVLHVERGKTYTFVVEGGVDPSNSARYHPFYITDSSKGGGSKEDRAVLGKKVLKHGDAPRTHK